MARSSLSSRPRLRINQAGATPSTDENTVTVGRQDADKAADKADEKPPTRPAPKA